MQKKRWEEILRFVVTGGVCFLIEFALLVLLRDTLHMPTLLSAALAFVGSVIVNYFLCLLWVFRGARGGRQAQAGFLVTSLIGLGINELCMFLFGRLWGEDGVIVTVLGFAVSMYMLSKVLSTLIVMVWNYLSKRYVLKRGEA
ncbi:MAG: GtrA family protein [Clostridia bacterium]|nr:GtrA family protein [Clostridia bacterium]